MERMEKPQALQFELASASQKRPCATICDPTLCLTSARLYATVLGYGAGGETLFDCPRFEPAEKVSAQRTGHHSEFEDRLATHPLAGAHLRRFSSI